jgi:hypothetical protein
MRFFMNPLGKKREKMIQEEEGKGAEGLFSDVESRMEAKRVAMEQELRSVMKRKREKKKESIEEKVRCC